MPTIEHDGIVELVRQEPSLALDLVRHVGAFALPDKVATDLGSEDMSDVTPRANGRERRDPGPQKYTADSVVIVSEPGTGKRLLAIVVEPQGKWTDEKGISWPVYATTARKANRCPHAVVIAVCWDDAEAERCRRRISIGHPDFIFIPIVISAGNAPPLDDAKPYLTLLNMIIGAVDLDTDDGRLLAIKAIIATGTTDADHRSLCAVMLNVASETAYEELRKLMAVTFKNEFIDSWVELGEARGEARGMAAGKLEGKIEGRAEGKIEGKIEGSAQTRADDILRVLKSRRLRPTQAQRKLIAFCEDLGKLDVWFDRSLVVGTVDELFAEDGEA